MTTFWRWLALFAYRRWAAREASSGIPMGVPGNRDPQDPCRLYAPRRRRLSDLADCQTDGHYLCGGCALRKVKRWDDAE